MRNQLPSFRSRRSKPHAINNVIKTRLKKRQQIHTGITLTAFGFCKISAKLFFQNAVHALDFLLFTQLQAIVGCTSTRNTTVLSRFGVEFSLVAKGTTSTLQKEISTLATRKFSLGAQITCHLFFLYYLPNRMGSY